MNVRTVGEYEDSIVKIRKFQRLREWKLKWLKTWENENWNTWKCGRMKIQILESLEFCRFIHFLFYILLFLILIYYIYITNSFYIFFYRYQLNTFFKSSKKNISSIFRFIFLSQINDRTKETCRIAVSILSDKYLIITINLTNGTKN